MPAATPLRGSEGDRRSAGRSGAAPPDRCIATADFESGFLRSCRTNGCLPRRRRPPEGGAEPVPDIDRGNRRSEIGELLLGKFRTRLYVDLVADTRAEQGQRFRPGQRGPLALRELR